MTTSDIVRLLIAALGRAAVGLERQWSGHAVGPDARFAGIRTFTMLGGVGGFSGWLWTAGVTAPAAILFAGAVTIVAAAYVAGNRQDIDGTTGAPSPPTPCSIRGCSRCPLAAGDSKRSLAGRSRECSWRLASPPSFDAGPSHVRSSLNAWFQLLVRMADSTHTMHIASR